jgi:serine/threonine-protein kinase
VWWAVGALILAAAAVVAIVFGDDLRGTSPADSQDTTGKAAAQSTAAPALPSSGESTAAPTDTATPTASTSATPTAPAGGEDPLGLGVPMTSPPCDGTWVVILGSATDPASYAEDVRNLLGVDPRARYVLTEGACSSLRQRTDEGNQIYAVYLGPYPDQTSACTVSTGIGGGVYVKRMDTTTPPEQTWSC